MKKIVISFLLICSLAYPQTPYNDIFFSIAVKELVLGVTFNDFSKIEYSYKTFKTLKKDLEENIDKILNLEKIGITYSNFIRIDFKNWKTLDEWIEECEKWLKIMEESKEYSIKKDTYEELCFGNFNDDYIAYYCLKTLEEKMASSFKFPEKRKVFEKTLSANKEQQRVLLQHILLKHSGELSIPELVAMCNNYIVFNSGLF